MYVVIVVALVVMAVALLGYFNRSFIFTRKCINCGCWFSHRNGVNMEEGFVCSECLHKTANPPDDGWMLPEDPNWIDEDGQADHAEAHYAAEEHRRQWEEFADTQHRNGIPIEDWFVDTIDEKEEKP